MEARPGNKQPSDPIHSDTLAEREDSRKVQMVRVCSARTKWQIRSLDQAGPGGTA